MLMKTNQMAGNVTCRGKSCKNWRHSATATSTDRQRDALDRHRGRTGRALGAKPLFPHGNFAYSYCWAIWLRKLGFSHALPTDHAVWLNTQNNAWFGSKISIICCELSGAPAPQTSHCFGLASGRTGRALPVPPHTRRRRTDSEYAECLSEKLGKIHVLLWNLV